MHKLFAVAALAGTGALVAATATHSTRSATAPAGTGSALLRRYDLTPLLRTVPTDGSYAEPMNGFFGPDRYRIELVTTKVQRDPRQPGRYQVWGKDRFKGHITAFTGTVTFTDARQTVAARSKDEPALYAATGTYELREATGTGAGTFRGRVATDFLLDDTKPRPIEVPDGPSKGGGLLYDGTWTSAAGQVKPAVWVSNIWYYHGPQVFQNFILGERDPHFNAKYAKLGWNNYWGNEEWWASSPQASAKAKAKL